MALLRWNATSERLLSKPARGGLRSAHIAQDVAYTGNMFRPSCGISLCVERKDYEVVSQGSSPFDRWAFAAHIGLGIGALQQDRFVQANSTLASTRFLHALATALAGRPDEAKSLLRDVQESEPNIGMRLVKEIGAVPEIIEKLAQGARILGLPEQ
jgi:hypothetical protein